MHPLSPTRDQIAGSFADRQHGVVSREQLLAAGWTREMIKGALAAGRLRRIYRGVYAVGHTALRRHGWWQAALLTCGDGSALGARSAGLVWSFGAWPVLPVEVVVSNDRGRKQHHLVPHRAELHAGETMRVDGLRVTTPARTIADLAATLDARDLRRVVERAQDLQRFHPAEIRRAARGRRGTKQLRTLLDLLEPDPSGARSHLERLFLAVVRRARVPRPEVNAVVAGRRRDFVWGEARLVVETDGYAHHSSKAAIRRDRELAALGWRAVRFTYEEVAFEPAVVAAELQLLLSGAAPARRSARSR